MKRTRGYWPAASAVVVLAGMLLSIGRAYLSSTDGHIVYALDDSYIQMAIAKNLAVHGTWGVTRYEFTGAGTSLLWPWVLAVLEWVVGRHDLMPFVLNVACAAGLVLLADRSLSRHVSSARLRFAVLVMLTVAAPLPVLPFIGMEHTLQCLLALGLAILAARL